jgi:O-antigen biosynthesis protein
MARANIVACNGGDTARGRELRGAGRPLRYVRASMSAPEERLIEWTGERCVPWVQDSAILYEHFHRYLWARELVRARTVLDLGSGEGFGASILAQAAEQVIGVDVDADAVAHASRSYAGERLRFERASALDLSSFAPGSFGAVVAFEMIEHVVDHERVLAEVERVLAEDGVFVVSTPDRDTYAAAAGHVNEFHEHELTIAELRALLRSRFAHVEMWGQRTITGSYLSALAPSSTPSPAGEDLFVRRTEQGIELDDPTPIFCVAVASRVPLPRLPRSSTLADSGLELVRETARAYAASVAERDALLGDAHEKLNEANRMLDEKRAEALALGDELFAARSELEALQRELELSVSWQFLQRARHVLYGAIDKDSRSGRAIGAGLRLLGRLALRRR